MDPQKLSIYICGAQGSGKTTLQNALENNPEFIHFNFKTQKEIARSWMENKKYTKEYLENRTNLYNFQYKLLRLQTSRENEEVSECNDKYSRFLWDRGVIDPIVFLKLHFGQQEALIGSNITYVQNALVRWKNGSNVLVFVTKPEKLFLEYDRIRFQGDFESIISMHNSTIEILNEFNINYTLIDKVELAERVLSVVKGVRQKWPGISENFVLGEDYF